MTDAAAAPGVSGPGRGEPPTGDLSPDVLLEGWSATGRAQWLQLAVDGRWEDARGVDMPSGADAARALVREAGPADADVAVEFEWLGHPLVFVGARRGRGGVSERVAFEDGVAHLAEQQSSGPLEALSALAGGPPRGPVHVELGAANAWHSVGPLRLWSADEGHAPSSIESLLRGRPELARCAVPVALAVAYDEPRSCWFGIEVSERSPGGCTVAPAVVDELLARLFAGRRGGAC